MNTVLVVVAHTDDEVLGCGGTIARHVDDGDAVYGIFIADGVSSRMDANQTDLATRNEAAENARIILGIKENFYLGLPDNRMDSIPLIDVVQKLEQIIDRLKPNIVYTHHHSDLNVDHQIAHQAVLTACRPVPGSGIQSIYTFEVMSSTEWAAPMSKPFVPDHYVEISYYLSTKNNALKAYELEMREAPHSRSFQHLEALARHRGHSVGVTAAEAFATVRTIRFDKKENS
jgi:N-acetylglucosamine malate deacetylase 1